MDTNEGLDTAECMVPFDLPSTKRFKRRRSDYENIRMKKRRKRHKHYESDSDPDYDPDMSDDDGENFFFINRVNVHAEDNHIYFRSSVEQKSVDKLIELIDKKNKEYRNLCMNKLISSCEPAPLYLHITSYGGSVLYGFKAIDAIINSELPVHTIVDGYAASAGTMMSVSGKKRYMTSHGYMLIHEITYGFEGKFKDLKDGMENSKRWMADIEDLYLKKTFINKGDLVKYMKHDHWWNYDKCKELGLVDELWEGTGAD